MKDTLRNLVLCGLLIAAGRLGAQTYDWARVIKGNDGQSVGDMIIGPDRKMYLSGFYESTCDFDPGAGLVTRTASSLTDAWFGKYDTLGNVIWLNSLDGSGAIYNDVNNGVMMLEVDNNSNVYACGAYYLDLDLDPGPGTYTLPFDGISDIFLAKYNVGGGLIWGFGIGSGDWDVPSQITLDKDQNILMSGAFMDTIDFDPGPGVTTAISAGLYDMFLAKYSPLGNLIWVKTWGSIYNDLLSGFTLTADGSIHLTGGYCAPIDLDPGPGVDMHSFAGEVDVFYLKLDEDGNYIDAMDIGGVGSESGSGVLIGNDGRIYIAGSFNDTLDFDPSPAMLNRYSAGFYTDIFYACYDSNFTPVWLNTLGNTGVEQVNGIELDANGDLITNGRFPYTLDLDPGAGTHDLTATGLPDMFLAKYKGTDGSLVWAGSIGSTGNEYSQDLELDDKGRIYIAGSFEKTVDFDLLAGTAFFTSVDEDDGFFARYVDEALTSSTDANQSNGISVYPSPTTGRISIRSDELLTCIQILNLQGQLVLDQPVSPCAELTLNAEHLPQGVYILNAHTNNGIFTSRIVIME